MEQLLIDAVVAGDAALVREILRGHPTVDVNSKGALGRSPLSWACEHGFEAIVALLLAHPGIAPNPTNLSGTNAFWVACNYGKTSCVRVLLDDPRVVTDVTDFLGHPSIWAAVCNGHQDVIKWWIASGRTMGLGDPLNWRTNALGVAKKMGMTDMGALLEEFDKNPVETRAGMRLELGWYDEVAAGVFALVVFVSDGLLQVTLGDQSTTAAARFFRIATQLPLELQMVLCYRVPGSLKEALPKRNSEAAFKTLATRI